jgi:hypothetical protein
MTRIGADAPFPADDLKGLAEFLIKTGETKPPKTPLFILNDNSVVYFSKQKRTQNPVLTVRQVQSDRINPFVK